MTQSSRIGDALARARTAGRPGLITYMTGGDPDLARSREVLLALDRGGADVIEVGVPFSDPVADGPAIQRATERALAAGVTLDSTLALIAGARAAVAAPIVVFTYVNPVLRLGTSEFVRRCVESGVDGVLLLDLPIEESALFHEALTAAGIDQVFLVSPTTSDARLAAAARIGRGFLYAISRLGVTGARTQVAVSAAPLVARIRAVSLLPVALGFGISRPEHVAEVGRYADAAVVGSALVQVVADAAARSTDIGGAVEQFVRWLKGSDRGDD
jgi:tryptophan synthase alpha chain